MKFTTMALATAAAAIAISPAYAKPHGDWRDNYTDSQWSPPGHGGATPPGLAKKPYGMPPGQAKKLHQYSIGQHLPRTYYRNDSYYLDNPASYQLAPPPPGYEYVRVDNDVYLTQTRSGLIAQVIADLLH